MEKLTNINTEQSKKSSCKIINTLSFHVYKAKKSKTNLLWYTFRMLYFRITLGGRT